MSRVIICDYNIQVSQAFVYNHQKHILVFGFIHHNHHHFFIIKKMTTEHMRRRLEQFDDEPEVDFNDFKSPESFEQHRAHAEWFLANVTNVTRFRRYGIHYRISRNLPRYRRPKREPNIALSRPRYRDRLSSLPDSDFEIFKSDIPVFLSEYSIPCTVEREKDPENFARILHDAKWWVCVLLEEIESRSGRVDGLTGARVIDSSFLTPIPAGAHRVYIGTHFSFWNTKKDKKKAPPLSPYCLLASDIVYKSCETKEEDEDDEEDIAPIRCDDDDDDDDHDKITTPPKIRRKRPRASVNVTSTHHDVLVA